MMQTLQVRNLAKDLDWRIRYELMSGHPDCRLQGMFQKIAPVVSQCLETIDTSSSEALEDFVEFSKENAVRIKSIRELSLFPSDRFELFTALVENIFTSTLSGVFDYLAFKLGAEQLLIYGKLYPNAAFNPKFHEWLESDPLTAQTKCIDFFKSSTELGQTALEQILFRAEFPMQRFKEAVCRIFETGYYAACSGTAMLDLERKIKPRFIFVGH